MVNEENLWGLKYFVNAPLYLLIIPYIALQPICRIWAKESGFYEKNKELCKKIMAGYNLIMTLFSFICCSVMINCLMNLRKGVFSVGHYEDEILIYPRQNPNIPYNLERDHVILDNFQALLKSCQV